MKTLLRNLFLAGLILMLALPALPAHPALAARERGTITLSISNHTAGEVSVRLSDAEGTYWVTLAAGGKKQVDLPEGRYEYYASTPCGAQSGVFSLNVSKKLNIDCKDELEVLLYKPSSCEQVLWVGSAWQWFELNPEWWPTLLSDPFYEAEMRCFDSSLPSHFEPFVAPG